jgi:transcription elongation factor Elf1
MSLHRSTQIPFRCPKCAALKGFPIGLVVEKDDNVVAVVRCKTCEHMWQMERKSDSAWPVAIASAES